MKTGWKGETQGEPWNLKGPGTLTKGHIAKSKIPKKALKQKKRGNKNYRKMTGKEGLKMPVKIGKEVSQEPSIWKGQDQKGVKTFGPSKGYVSDPLGSKKVLFWNQM